MRLQGIAFTACLITSLAGCGVGPSVNQPAPMTLTADSQSASTGEVSMADGFEKTESGLQYKIITAGDGPKPTANNSVTAHYKGWLDDGTIFDETSGSPIDFPLNGVIGGWTEGLQLIGVGGEIELIIPSELGYGARGAGADIPPHATLHFNVKLVDVK